MQGIRTTLFKLNCNINAQIAIGLGMQALNAKLLCLEGQERKQAS